MNNELETRLNDLLELKNDLVCRQIDAASCGFESGRNMAHKAEEKFEDALESFLLDFNPGKCW